MFQLKIDQEFNAPVAILFNAWSKPEILAKWFAPGDMSVPEAALEFKKGGQYRIVMENKEREQFIVGGTYLEINAPNKLVFSWQWSTSPHITQVTVLFSELADNKSKLELIHTEFETQEFCDKHHQGWMGCLANLPKVL